MVGKTHFINRPIGEFIVIINHWLVYAGVQIVTYFNCGHHSTSAVAVILSLFVYIEVRILKSCFGFIEKVKKRNRSRNERFLFRKSLYWVR